MSFAKTKNRAGNKKHVQVANPKAQKANGVVMGQVATYTILRP
jgi:hypothetical protein